MVRPKKGKKGTTGMEKEVTLRGRREERQSCRGAESSANWNKHEPGLWKFWQPKKKPSGSKISGR